MSKQLNQVRPRMSRENYAWLKSFHGKDNDERIDNLRNELFESSYKALKFSVEARNANKEIEKQSAKIQHLQKCLAVAKKAKARMKSERDSFVAYLSVSVAINSALIGYIAILQGWF